jgi:hypothetical protein
LKKARSRAQNFLARFWPEFLTTFNGSFAQHHSDGIAECEPLLASCRPQFRALTFSVIPAAMILLVVPVNNFFVIAVE